MNTIEPQPSIHHFSHHHPLNLISDQTPTTENPTCYACNKPAIGHTYTCKTCNNYTLHKACSKLPQKLYHGVDTKHALTLLDSPAYEESQFTCNACGAFGSGFCYRCDRCELDLHPVCAFIVSSLVCEAHEHALDLRFEPPYENKVFKCDICGGLGSNHWLYRCGGCEFDAHLKCAMGNRERVAIRHHNEQV